MIKSKWRRLPEIFYTPPPEADFQVNYGEKPMQTIYVRIPASSGPHPSLLVLHGGSWKSGYNYKQMEYVSESLRNLGFATFNIEYSRVGHAKGGWPYTFIDLINATNTIAGLASSLNLDTKKVGLLGHSSGGHLAFWLSAFNRQKIQEFKDYDLSLEFAAVISLAGILDLADAWKNNILRKEIGNLLDGIPDELSGLYKITSPAELLPIPTKQVLIYGSKDRLIPPFLSENYYKKVIDHGGNVTLVPINGCAHFRLIDPTSKYWSEISNTICNSFEEKELKQKPFQAKLNI
jgi:acetyl esterase/lipase